MDSGGGIEGSQALEGSTRSVFTSLIDWDVELWLLFCPWSFTTETGSAAGGARLLWLLVFWVLLSVPEDLLLLWPPASL